MRKLPLRVVLSAEYTQASAEIFLAQVKLDGRLYSRGSASRAELREMHGQLIMVADALDALLLAIHKSSTPWKQDKP